MFDVKLRDKLLFEDSHFTYSRRYFWAYNTLGVINEGIKAMIAAYVDTFTADFWAGRHQILWPLKEISSPEAVNYLEKMNEVKREIDHAVDDLRKAMDKNERTRKEIANLREQLFAGSSVRESRRAVEQGDNIKILTGVSMLFLPLTFVTVSTLFHLPCVTAELN
jgi:Mg2+ and Co2+ transporter CorA